MKKVFALVLAAVLLLSAAACGGKTEEPQTSGNPQNSSDPQTSTNPTQPAKDTLVVSALTTGHSLDPNTAAEFDRMVINSVYDTLFVYDENGDPAPCLAESWKEEGMTITLHLRQGVKFHDGTDFNADALLVNYEKYLESEYAVTFEQYVSDMEKVDEYTVTVTKATPYSSFIDNCCCYFYIQSPAVLQSDPESLKTKPVGTGAYVFDRMDEASGYVYLNANPDYFMGKPSFEHIEVHTFLDSATALIALQNGELDLYMTPTNSDLEIAKADSKLVTASTTGWTQTTVTMFGEPYISDENLRKAVYYAINRENAAIYNDVVDPTYSKDLFASSIMGEYSGAVAMDGYDVELAKQYLEQSNYNGETLEINVFSGMDNIAVSIQSDLQAIGINSKVSILDSGTWVSRIFDGTVGITTAQLGGSYSCLEEMLITFYSYEGYYGSMGILAMDDACAKAISDAAAIEDTAARGAATIEAYKQAVALYNMAPVYEDVFNVVYSANLKGIEAKWAASGCPYLYKVTLA